MAEIALRDANQIGWQAMATWRLPDGTIVESTFSQAEYEAWAARGTGEPPRPAIMHPDAVWTGLARGGAMLLDTPSGKMEEGVVLRTVLPVAPGGTLAPLKDHVLYRSPRAGGEWETASVSGANLATINRQLEPGVRLFRGVLITG